MLVVLALLVGAVVGAVVGPGLHHALRHHLHSRPPPCFDVYAGGDGAALWHAGALHAGDYGRPGLAHATLAGARHHGLRRVELWLQTFAPGVGTPIHRHDAEEVFWVQRGRGTAHVQRPGGGGVQAFPLAPNDTLVVLPNVVHQIRNNYEGGEDLQLLEAFDHPPLRVHTYEAWGAPDRDARLVAPYYWDAACPPQQLTPQRGQDAARSDGEL